MELRALALNGLCLEASKVQVHHENHPKDITTAAFNLLMEWHNSQKDKQIAYKELCKGLKNSNLEHYIATVLKPKDKTSAAKS